MNAPTLPAKYLILYAMGYAAGYKDALKAEAEPLEMTLEEQQAALDDLLEPRELEPEHIIEPWDMYPNNRGQGE